LNDLLEHLAKTLPMLSDVITQQYLSHLQTSRHLAGFELAPRLENSLGGGL
jgi:hypothetical protein